ncbi:MAG: DUF4175 domain-containing protein [Alphaproteobacteria bacterium]
MLDPLDLENRPFINVLSKKRRIAATILSAENITLHFWRLLFWTLFFCGLWMLDIPLFLGETAAIITSLIFLFGVIYLIKEDVITLSFPKRKQIDQSLENTSGLPQGHIAILDDTLANPKTHLSRGLWEENQKQILKSLFLIKSPKKRAILSREDPSAIRFIAILVFVSGMMVSGPQWHDKITNGIIPITPNHIVSNGNVTNLWITPPSYTGIGKQHIIGANIGNDNALNIPEGSDIRIRLHSVLGKHIPPHLNNGDDITPMKYLGSGLYSIEDKIKNGDNLSVTQGYFPRARWSYNYIIDTPPEISNDNKQANNPTSIEDTNNDKNTLNPDSKENDTNKAELPLYEFIDGNQIRFPTLVKDDYGVKEIHMRMDIDKIVEEKPLGNHVEEYRLIMSQPNTEFKISPIFNMTWHTWSGLPVTFEYTAIDHKGQKTKLDKIHLILPEREFEHPMAKSLISMRKRLAWDYRDSFIDVALNLKSLLNAPEYFQNNPVIYLAIKTSSARLIHVNNKDQETRLEAAQEVIKLLWNAALVVEDGNLSMAVRELREAQSALENALRDPNASDDEISKLMNNLRDKMANYFAEKQRDMQKRMAEGEKFPEISPDQFNSIISPDTLSKIVEEIESALRSGDEKKAQELMSKLQRMMEMMDDSGASQLPSDMQAMREGINELQELIERQEQLLEQTKKLARTEYLREEQNKTNPRNLPSIEEMLKEFGMTGIPPTPKRQAPENDKPSSEKITNKKVEQAALRYILGQLMLEISEKIDEIPEAMGLAEQEMRKSENYLGESKPNASLPHQGKAIDYLKDSQEELSQEFKQRMQQMVGISMGGAGQKYDPLGRSYGGEENNGKTSDQNVKVPDAAQKKKVDEILKTLRERSGDFERPDDERSYFRRLLRQF